MLQICKLSWSNTATIHAAVESNHKNALIGIACDLGNSTTCMRDQKIKPRCIVDSLYIYIATVLHITNLEVKPLVSLSSIESSSRSEEGHGIQQMSERGVFDNSTQYIP